jgi:hypothetical protein
LEPISKSEEEKIRFQNLNFELERTNKEFNALIDEIRTINKRNTTFMDSEFKNIDHLSSEIKPKKQVQSKINYLLKKR